MSDQPTYVSLEYWRDRAKKAEAERDGLRGLIDAAKERRRKAYVGTVGSYSIGYHDGIDDICGVLGIDLFEEPESAEPTS